MISDRKSPKSTRMGRIYSPGQPTLFLTKKNLVVFPAVKFLTVWPDIGVLEIVESIYLLEIVEFVEIVEFYGNCGIV